MIDSLITLKPVKKAISYIIMMVLPTLMIAGCTGGKSWQRDSGMIWHTTWHATWLGTEDMLPSVIDSLRSVEKSLSSFDPNSLISAINKSESGPVDRHLRKVYEMSRTVNKRSNGMFDPTISRLIDIWGFGKDHTPSADTAMIAAILPSTGIGKTHIENGVLYKDNPDISFNFSAIAKGYGVDVAATALENLGCHDLMVEIGGEIVCRGRNKEGNKWRIQIETPDEEYLREVFDNNSKPVFSESIIVELDNEALATSGNYRNYRKGSGQTYGHTISPVTGYPAVTDILSASVIAPSCMEADAMATACMAAGSEKGMEMLTSEGLAGAFILYSGEVVVNDMMLEHLLKK